MNADYKRCHCNFIYSTAYYFRIETPFETLLDGSACLQTSHETQQRSRCTFASVLYYNVLKFGTVDVLMRNVYWIAFVDFSFDIIQAFHVKYFETLLRNRPKSFLFDKVFNNFRHPQKKYQLLKCNNISCQSFEQYFAYFPQNAMLSAGKYRSAARPPPFAYWRYHNHCWCYLQNGGRCRTFTLRGRHFLNPQLASLSTM